MNFAQNKSTQAIALWERALTILRAAPEEHQEAINDIIYSLHSARASQVGERGSNTSVRYY